MLRKYLLFFSCVIILSFVGCSFGCEKLYFQENEIYWTTTYEKGDMAIFQYKLDSLKRDTIFILDKTHSLPTGKCNPAVSTIDPEAYTVDFKYSHNKTMSDSNYLLQHVKDKQQTTIPVIRIYDVEFNQSTLKDTSIVLQGFGKQEGYLIDNLEKFNNIPDFKIKNFVWSKKLGLVQINTENGEQLNLIKMIHAKQKIDIKY